MGGDVGKVRGNDGTGKERKLGVRKVGQVEGIG